MTVMRRSRALLPLVLLVTLPAVGCTHYPSQEELAGVYRTGMTRAEAADLFRGREFHGDAPVEVQVRPADGWPAVEQPVYRTENLLSRFERDHGVTVQTCEVWVVPRGFMGMGMYWDYLWYGPDDRLLGFRRRFVD